MSESLEDTKAEAQARTESTHMSKSVRMIGRSGKDRSSNFHELPLAGKGDYQNSVTYRLKLPVALELFQKQILIDLLSRLDSRRPRIKEFWLLAAFNSTLFTCVTMACSQHLLQAVNFTHLLAL